MFTLDHANINVTDIDKSTAFYAQAFGLKEVRRKTADDGRYVIVFMEDGVTGFGLELTWLEGKQGAYNLGDNESHIGFATDDFDAAYAHHKQMGIICYENKAMGVYFIVDPDGYWQEVKPRRR
jgi:lactoylglutathione lyase